MKKNDVAAVTPKKPVAKKTASKTVVKEAMQPVVAAKVEVQQVPPPAVKAALVWPFPTSMRP